MAKLSTILSPHAKKERELLLQIEVPDVIFQRFTGTDRCSDDG